MTNCECCGVEFKKKYTSQKYCSRSCSAKTNNKTTKLKHGRNVAGRVCSECSSPITSGETGLCKPCWTRNRHAPIFDQWLAGEDVFHSEYSPPESVRKFLLEEVKYCCSKCGWSGTNPRTENTTLQINHIDGIASNNRRSNLEVLCPNCHSLTPNFGNLNNGFGRSYRYAKLS